MMIYSFKAIYFKKGFFLYTRLAPLHMVNRFFDTAAAVIPCNTIKSSAWNICTSDELHSMTTGAATKTDFFLL